MTEARAMTRSSDLTKLLAAKKKGSVRKRKRHVGFRSAIALNDFPEQEHRLWCIALRFSGAMPGGAIWHPTSGQFLSRDLLRLLDHRLMAVPTSLPHLRANPPSPGTDAGQSLMPRWWHQVHRCRGHRFVEQREWRFHHLAGTSAPPTWGWCRLLSPDGIS